MPLTSSHEEPIVAQCTPQGPGAIALIRISGSGAVLVATRIASCSSGSLDQAATHTIHHGHVIRPDGSMIDDVLFFVMHAPRTYTGQDTVEISCHNNQLIVDEIIACALNAGARPAGPGEYTERAFLAGKLKLEQAEAVHDLICAPNRIALRRSLEQLSGSLANYLAHFEELLVSLAVLLETSFEFIEEEQGDLNFSSLIQAKINQISDHLVGLAQSCAQQAALKRGIKIVIAGPTNAGKSTLFNALLGSKRAIVSDVAGTTRDHIEATVLKQGTLWALIDTAGLRETNDPIEREGIAHTQNELVDADLILFVVDGTTPIMPELPTAYTHKTILVINKSDLGTQITNTDFPYVTISAQHGTGLSTLETVISTKLNSLCAAGTAPFMLNDRQRPLVAHAIAAFADIRTKIADGVDYEMIAPLVRKLVEHLSGLTGKDVDRRVIDEIFKSFCVGK